jgi:TP53 regulating kinase-like protein
LIDFGLSKSTTSVEEQAVDLYVLERALLSTHPDLPEHFFDKVLESYASVANKASEKVSQSTLQRLEQVRQRGRKRECFG